MVDTRIESPSCDYEARRHGLGLPPVIFIVRSGAVVLQDYLTPDQARRIAELLIAAADAPEEGEEPAR